jgi:hypothetical protein
MAGTTGHSRSNEDSFLLVFTVLPSALRPRRSHPGLPCSAPPASRRPSTALHRTETAPGSPATLAASSTLPSASARRHTRETHDATSAPSRKGESSTAPSTKRQTSYPTRDGVREHAADTSGQHSLEGRRALDFEEDFHAFLVHHSHIDLRRGHAVSRISAGTRHRAAGSSPVGTQPSRSSPKKKRGRRTCSASCCLSATARSSPPPPPPPPPASSLIS